MKLAFYDDFRLAAVEGHRLVDLTEIVENTPHRCPQELIVAVIDDFDRLRPLIEQTLQESAGIPLAGVRLRPPLPRPGTIVCMAANYMEDGTHAEPPPINAFLKSPSAIIGPGDTMELPDVPAKVFEGEAEFAIVIGKRAKNVSAANAMQHVFGYVNFIDGSARGLLPAGNTFYQMKSRDTFAPIGPYLVTVDEIADPHDLAIELTVNGVSKQSFSTSDMAHAIPRCIEWVSAIHTLEPGDLLATGTNHLGLNAFHDSDAIELETAGLGRLCISVRDPLQRTWSRETRRERLQKGLDPVAPQLSGKYAKT